MFQRLFLSIRIHPPFYQLWPWTRIMNLRIKMFLGTRFSTFIRLYLQNFMLSWYFFRPLENNILYIHKALCHFCIRQVLFASLYRTYNYSISFIIQLSFFAVTPVVDPCQRNSLKGSETRRRFIIASPSPC